MADMADVMDSIAEMALAAVYPNGVNAPSVTGHLIDVAEGWPLAEDLDKGMTGDRSMVTIFPVPGTTGNMAQVFDWNPGLIRAPVHGMTVEVDDSQFVLNGQPGVGEFATAIVNGVDTYSYAAVAGDTATLVMAGLYQLILSDHPDAELSDLGIYIPTAFSLIVRIGASGTYGRKTHTQRQQFRTTVWSPNPQDRTIISNALDIAYKDVTRFKLADTSFGIMTYQSSFMNDKEENNNIYRRDLIFTVQYDTISTFEAYEITAVRFVSKDGKRINNTV